MALSSELDFFDDVRRVYAEQLDAGEDSIVLGACSYHDCRVGPVRMIERHLAVVCAIPLQTALTVQTRPVPSSGRGLRGHRRLVSAARDRRRDRLSRPLPAFCTFDVHCPRSTC